MHGGTGVRAGSASLTGTPPHAGFEQTVADAQRRMRAYGWHDVRRTTYRPGPHASPPATAYVTGTRAGYLVAVEVDAADGDNPAALSLDLMWAEPPGHLAATVAGGVASALVAALVGWSTAKRMRGRARGAQRTYSLLCLATLLMLAPACLGNIPTATGSLLADTNRNHPGPSVFWGGFVIFGAEPLAILSLVPILAVVVLCLRPRPQPGRTPTTA